MGPNILVLGIGNTLLSDEGVGVHAIQRLAAEAGADSPVNYLDGGTLSFVLAGSIEDADQLIVVDAAELDAPPGTVKTYEGEDMDSYLGANRKRSVHEVSLLDLMAVVHLSGRLPGRRALVGIQPHSTDWGDTPTTAVSAAIPRACDAVRNIIGKWQS